MQSIPIPQAMELAVQCHQAGRLAESEAICRQVLAQQPGFAEAHNQLGLTQMDQGKPAEAEAAFRRAASLREDSAEFHNNLGTALRAQGRADDAVVAFRRAVGLLGDSPEPHHNLGVALLDAARNDEAAAELRWAIELRSDFPDAHFSLGVALERLGRLDAAIAAFREALALRPNSQEFHFNLGLALKKKGGLDEAIAAYRQAIVLRPDNPVVYNNLGNALWQKGEYDAAIIACRQAIAHRPDYAEAYTNMGNSLREKGQLAQAIAAHRQAIALKANFPEAHNNLGVALRDMRHPDEAVGCYQQAIALQPDYAKAHVNYSVCLLQGGDFQRGWPEYEWRWKTDEMARSLRSFPQPRWDGRPLEGKTILLHAEQGIGDTLLFARYVSRVVDRGGRVVLECQPELLRLMHRLVGVGKLIGRGEPDPPAFDVHCPLASLPLMFDTRPETLPTEMPYLTADPQRVEEWTKRLSLNRDRLNVGLVWSGAILPNVDRRKSMSLAQLAPLAEAKGVQFYSLQKGNPATEAARPPAGMNLIDLGAHLTDFADTAAVIANLDLIITVDTSVANLVGAMGRADWIMLPFVSDWRWMLESDRTPWYPTLRLFRQAAFGDWPAVVWRVAEELAKWPK